MPDRARARSSQSDLEPLDLERLAARRAAVVFLQVAAQRGITLAKLAEDYPGLLRYLPYLGTITIEEIREGIPRTRDELRQEIRECLERHPGSRPSQIALALDVSITGRKVKRLMAGLASGSPPARDMERRASLARVSSRAEWRQGAAP